jgi:hypothetical protein
LLVSAAFRRAAAAARLGFEGVARRDFGPPKKVDDRRESAAGDVSALIRTLTRQSNAILCVSARSQAIGDKLKNLNRGQPFSDIVMGLGILGNQSGLTCEVTVSVPHRRSQSAL